MRDRLRAVWTHAQRNPDGAVTEMGLKSLVSVLEGEGHRLRTAAGRPEASILIAVDQAEELIRGDSASSEALADYLRAAISAQSRWQLAFTISNRQFRRVTNHKRFQNLNAHGYDLRTLPGFRFASVVEAPAQRYGVAVDFDLVDELAEDAPKEDALPLLAFALQRLWRQYAGREG